MTDNYRDVAADFLAPVRHFYLVEEEYEAHLTAATKRLKQLARGWRKEGALLKDVFGQVADVEDTVVICADKKDEAWMGIGNIRNVCHNTINLEKKDEDS